MLQFNLLPDVKLQYIKAERQKNMVISISTIVTIASLAVLVLLLITVFGIQRKHIHDLGADMDTTAKQLQEVEDLDKILTVQNQLNSLGGLHNGKIVSSRLYTYLAKITPAFATISSLKADYTMNTLEVSGSVGGPKTLNKFSIVNKYADSFKFTTYKVKSSDEPAAAFTNVVLSNISRADEEAEYTVTMSFDPRIFSNESPVILEVPNIIVTRPDVEQPKPLFKPQATDAQHTAPAATEGEQQ
jgi:hypothetical protein